MSEQNKTEQTEEDKALFERLWASFRQGYTNNGMIDKATVDLFQTVSRCLFIQDFDRLDSLDSQLIHLITNGSTLAGEGATAEQRTYLAYWDATKQIIRQYLNKCPGRWALAEFRQRGFQKYEGLLVKLVDLGAVKDLHKFASECGIEFDQCVKIMEKLKYAGFVSPIVKNVPIFVATGKGHVAVKQIAFDLAHRPPPSK